MTSWQVERMRRASPADTPISYTVGPDLTRLNCLHYRVLVELSNCSTMPSFFPRAIPPQVFTVLTPTATWPGLLSSSTQLFSPDHRTGQAREQVQKEREEEERVFFRGLAQHAPSTVSEMKNSAHYLSIGYR